MRTFTLSFFLLAFGAAGFAQKPADQEENAPPAVDQALRARVDQYFGAFMAGKYKDAYELVAADSQDAFLAADKEQYKACELIKIRYSDHFKRATVLESCKTEWAFHGTRTPTTFPITTTWKVAHGKWFWYYEKPKEMPFPFSPTGFIPVPSDAELAKQQAMPRNMVDAARNILSKVSVDKETVHLLPDHTSKDVVTVHNGMPGEIELQLNNLSIPGLSIKLNKSKLEANQDATLTFEYNLNSSEIACIDCAKKIRGTPFVSLHVIPTAQIFNIEIIFGSDKTSHIHVVPANPQPSTPSN